MNKLKDALKRVNETVIYRVEGLDIEVRILDARIAYGTIRYKITPVAGGGTKWTTKELR
jgi:hypothetical protein